MTGGWVCAGRAFRASRVLRVGQALGASRTLRVAVYPPEYEYES